MISERPACAGCYCRCCSPSETDKALLRYPLGAGGWLDPRVLSCPVIVPSLGVFGCLSTGQGSHWDWRTKRREDWTLSKAGSAAAASLERHMVCRSSHSHRTVVRAGIGSFATVCLLLGYTCAGQPGRASFCGGTWGCLGGPCRQPKQCVNFHTGGAAQVLTYVTLQLKTYVPCPPKLLFAARPDTIPLWSPKAMPCSFAKFGLSVTHPHFDLHMLLPLLL